MARAIDAVVVIGPFYWLGTRAPRWPEVVIGYVGFIFRLAIRTTPLAGIDRMALVQLSGAVGAVLGTLIYFVLCEARGQTIGKRMVGVRVVSTRTTGHRGAGGKFVGEPLVGDSLVGDGRIGVGIIDFDGEGSVGRAQALGRSLAGVLTAIPFGLGAFAMLWDRQRRTWADLMADTRVIRVGWNAQVDSLARPVFVSLLIVVLFAVAIPCLLLITTLQSILDLPL